MSFYLFLYVVGNVKNCIYVGNHHCWATWTTWWTSKYNVAFKLFIILYIYNASECNGASFKNLRTTFLFPVGLGRTTWLPGTTWWTWRNRGQGEWSFSYNIWSIWIWPIGHWLFLSQLHFIYDFREILDEMSYQGKKVFLGHQRVI